MHNNSIYYSAVKFLDMEAPTSLKSTGLTVVDYFRDIEVPETLKSAGRNTADFIQDPRTLATVVALSGMLAIGFVAERESESSVSIGTDIVDCNNGPREAGPMTLRIPAGGSMKVGGKRLDAFPRGGFVSFVEGDELPSRREDELRF